MATTRPKPKRYVRRLQARKPCVHGPAGIELRPHQVLIRPLVTEKGTHQSSKYNAYTFEVNPMATKTQIAAAVTELFHVKVEKVRTQLPENFPEHVADSVFTGILGSAERSSAGLQMSEGDVGNGL